MLVKKDKLESTQIIIQEMVGGLHQKINGLIKIG